MTYDGTTPYLTYLEGLLENILGDEELGPDDRNTYTEVERRLAVGGFRLPHLDEGKATDLWVMWSWLEAASILTSMIARFRAGESRDDLYRELSPDNYGDRLAELVGKRADSMFSTAQQAGAWKYARTLVGMRPVEEEVRGMVDADKLLKDWRRRLMAGLSLPEGRLLKIASPSSEAKEEWVRQAVKEWEQTRVSGLPSKTPEAWSRVEKDRKDALEAWLSKLWDEYWAAYAQQANEIAQGGAQ